MIETTLLKEIRKVLSEFIEYWDNEKLLKNRVSEDLRNYDPELITALLSNEKIKEDFEISINDTSIFKIEEFIQMLTYKDFWEDSYTKYSNKIGLTAGGKYLDYNSDVVLDFPFKDCILEGGMTKEEVGKKEVYYNKVIARDEVDTLLSPKVLTNTKKYTKDNEEEVSEISDTDNLIIKGNNLLALHSLKERYAGKVKCIYIDPPYNTGGDSFKYNDRFNHSTWLTFMKNRLEVARELLSENGIIAVQTDYHESAYVSILLDEIFGFGAKVADIAVKMSTPSGPKMAHVNSTIPKLKDSIAIYAKGKVEIIEPPYKPKDKWDNEYSKILMNFEYDDFLEVKEAILNSDIISINKILAKVKLSTLSKEFPKSKTDSNWLYNNAWRIVADKQNTGIDKLLSQKNKKYFQDVEGIKSKKGNIVLFRTDKDFGKDTRLEIIFAVDNLKEHTGDLWTDISTSGGFSEEGGVNFPTAKKPERLLKRLISMFTKRGEIVLDFFMGSATTQAVAMKMNRQFIGIEQMDYINTVSVSRLQKVMEGEQGGISKGVSWQGGGSFIYTELMDLNNAYINQIKEAKTSTELLDILETIKKYADLNYLVELEKLTNEPITIDEDTKETLSFEELSIDKQRELLIDVMDINQLYVNYSEIDDSMYHVSEQDKAFNRSFYEEGDN
ncbi:site-specific DNA-methyltransferase [Vagococcus jeotgali]|uniref:site-specific DNA-methyltransferase n=1 Tax=Vagococcus jeotgali TaxID=3109030 RepID=UPI002DD8E265|nr:site-specific DNA-methyltransferase [Vagococcus sp. B2T-5]